VVAINVTWHGYRTWLPLYLVEKRGYSEAAMSRFTTLYYLVADIGSWTVGFFTLWLVRRRGMGVHASRVLAYTAHISLALIYPIEGWISDRTGSYDLVLGGIGAAPLLALGLLLWKWPPRREPAEQTPPAASA
jgi:ACS family hexuronate transporter-like MFS transporter